MGGLARAAVPMGLALAVLMASGPADAHALYHSSDPPANAILPSAPSSVTIHVTERVSPGSASIAVTDVSGGGHAANGTRISTLDARVISTDVTGIDPGVYTVVWRVTSADDGHPSAGSFTFCMQDTSGTCPGTLAETDTGATQSPTSAFDVVLRAASYLAAASTIGAMGLSLLVWHPSTDRLPKPMARSARRGQLLLLMWGGGHAFGLAAYSTAWLAWSLISLTDADAGAAISGSVFLQSLLLRAVLAAVLGGFLFAAYFALRRSQAARPAGAWVLVGFLLAAPLVVPIGAASHAAAVPSTRLLGATADASHVLFVSLWAGGLLALLVVRGSLAGPKNALLAKRVLTRFSTLATVALAGVVIAGVLLSVSQVGSLEGLVSTSFGLVVLAKVSFLLPMAGLGAVNHFKSIPLLRDPTTVVAAAARVAANVRAEAALGATILVLSGLLTTLVPATSLDVEPAEPQAYFLTQVRDGVEVELQVYPPPVGPGRYILSILLTRSDTGEVFLNSTNATATFTLPDSGLPDQREEMLGPHDNHYFIETTALSQVGNWRVTISIERTDRENLVVAFNVNIVGAGAAE